MNLNFVVVVSIFLIFRETLEDSMHALFAMDDTKQHEYCELIFLKHFPHSSFLSLTFMHTRMQNTSIPAKDKGKVYMCKATMKSTANYI